MTPPLAFMFLSFFRRRHAIADATFRFLLLLRRFRLFFFFLRAYECHHITHIGQNNTVIYCSLRRHSRLIDFRC